VRLVLLKPFLRSARNRLFPVGGLPLRTLSAGAFGSGLCVIIHLVSVRVISHFHGQNELGVILSLKILHMAWVILFAMLFFSCMVSAVSGVFLSRDNELVCAAPVRPCDLFFARFCSVTFYTSWMAVFFSLPVFLAYVRVFHAGWGAVPLVIGLLACQAATASGLGMILTVVLVNLFPARRTKDIVLYLSLCFGLFLYFAFRLMRPEELMNPDRYVHFVEYLSSVSRPAGPFAPPSWAAEMFSQYLVERRIDFLFGGLLVTTPAVLFFAGEWCMERWFLSGYTKAQESFGGQRRFVSKTGFRRGIRRAVFKKETSGFLRDSTAWSQLFMVAALVVVYLYNFRVLPLDRSYLQREYLGNLIAFLNIGLTGFVMTSLSARFAYPSIGAEGPAFVFIQSSPLSMRRFVFYKYLFYCIPLTLFGLLLVLASNHLLGITGPMWWISAGSILTTGCTVSALALGFGAAHADFRAENRTGSLGDMGTFLFILAAGTFQIVAILCAVPASYRFVRAWIRHLPLTVLDFAALVLGVLAVLIIAAAVSGYSLSRAVRLLEWGE